MGWMGKVIGGTIGFALGGPLGAVAGAAFGHAFDKEEGQRFGDVRERLSGIENSQLAFFVATFSMLAKLVKADGRVSHEEMEVVEQFMARDLNLDADGRRIAMNIFRAALNSPGSFEDFARQFHMQFSTQPQMLELLIDILLKVSVADGDLNRDEERLVVSAVNIFQMRPETFDKIRAKYVRNIDKYYAVLGARPTDTDAQIKHQYRKMVSEYHPDKIAAMGLPEEFNKFAHDKFREIQEAYEQIKKERNLK